MHRVNILCFTGCKQKQDFLTHRQTFRKELFKQTINPPIKTRMNKKYDKCFTNYILFYLFQLQKNTLCFLFLNQNNICLFSCMDI